MKGYRTRANDVDAARDFRPCPGHVVRRQPPQGADIRVDSGVVEGAMVPPYYDSMIAKLIVHGAMITTMAHNPSARPRSLSG